MMSDGGRARRDTMGTFEQGDYVKVGFKDDSMKQPQPGDNVSFFDEWKRERKTGHVVAVRRSAKNPWQVAIVQLQDGAEVDVHPDRLEAAEEGQRGAVVGNRPIRSGGLRDR